MQFDKIKTLLEQLDIISIFILLVTFPISIITGLIIMYLVHFFFPSFEKRYNLDCIYYEGFFSSKNTSEILRSKLYILVALAHYYLSPYWCSFFNDVTKQFLEKREKAQDAYYLACRHLIDERYPIDKIPKMEYLEKDRVFKGLCMRNVDLKVFITVERLAIVMISTGVLAATSALFSKYGIPYLFQYFWVSL